MSKKCKLVTSIFKVIKLKIDKIYYKFAINIFADFKFMMNFSEIMGNNLFLISFFQILFYFAELF